MIFLPSTFIQGDIHSQDHSRLLVDTDTGIFTAGMQQQFGLIQVLQDELCHLIARPCRNLQPRHRSVLIPKRIHHRNRAKLLQQVEMPVSTEKVSLSLQRKHIFVFQISGDIIIVKEIIHFTQILITGLPVGSAAELIILPMQALVIFLGYDIITVFLFTANSQPEFRERWQCHIKPVNIVFDLYRAGQECAGLRLGYRFPVQKIRTG